MESGNDASSKADRAGSIESDLSLVRAVADGSIPAWHEFINRYSGLIYSVVRRHLLTDDEDEIRGAWTDILKALYEGELSKYRGEARLSTWLIVSTRSRTIDLFRKLHGRIRTPEGFDRLSEFDKRVFHLFYIDRLPLEIILQVLSWSGVSPRVDAVVESIERIERTMDPRYLRRLEDEHRARKSGAGSVRILRYLVQQKLELENQRALTRADQALLEAEVLETASRLREALAGLSPRERRIVALRFGRGWTAGKIAERLRLENPEQVYRLIDRILSTLRKAFPTGKR